jgi:hypothetical protein
MLQPCTRRGTEKESAAPRPRQTLRDLAINSDGEGPTLDLGNRGSPAQAALAIGHWLPGLETTLYTAI